MLLLLLLPLVFFWETLDPFKSIFRLRSPPFGSCAARKGPESP